MKIFAFVKLFFILLVSFAMIHRSSSSHRRKTTRSSGSGSSKSSLPSTGSSVRKRNVAFEQLTDDDDDKDASEYEPKFDRKYSGDLENTKTETNPGAVSGAKLASRVRDGSSSNISTYFAGSRSNVSASSVDQYNTSFSPLSYPPEKSIAENMIKLNEYPLQQLGGGNTVCESSIIGSVTSCKTSTITSETVSSFVGSCHRIPSTISTSSDMTGRTTRSALLQDICKSPRGSLVPEDAYSRGPRRSIDPSVLNRDSKNSLLPDPEVYDRSSRPSMVADINALRNSRNSLLPSDVSPNRSPRNSLVPNEINRSPRSSLVPEISRSPRSSLVPESNRTPRGSLVAEVSSRSPRGSVTSEGSVYSYNRSSRSSLQLQDGSTTIQSRSPRGSLASTTGVQFAQSTKTPRGSIELVPTGMARSSGSHRSFSPYHTSSLRGNQSMMNTSTVENVDDSRRASSSVSQVGVSTDDRRHLCEHTKLNPEAGLHLTAYGSFIYQLNHANMESSDIFDFLLRALTIMYRTAIVTVLLSCFTMLPLIMLIMGLEFIRDCPKEPHIPIYMVVGGCFGLMKISWILWVQIRSLRYERLNPPDTAANENEDMLATSVGTKIGCFALSVFLIIWFICGNYWILHIYWPDYEPTLFKPDNWCHKTLYVFSIVHLIIIYLILFCVLLIIVVVAGIQICLLRCR